MKHISTTFYLWVTFMLLFFPSCLSAQTNNGDPYYHSSPLDNMLLPSPESASLLRYVDCPVSYCTGVANYDVPIYSCKGRELSLDVSLSYHTSGSKAKEKPGIIGREWNLRGGGVITRVINGLPDEYKKFKIHPLELFADEGTDSLTLYQRHSQFEIGCQL